MSSSRPHSGIHCLNCDLWDSRISMIFRSHCPDRDSTPCFGLEQASMSKSQHGLVGAELNARARGTVPEYMWLPDNRKALDGLWELSIIVPPAAFSRAFGAEDCDLLAGSQVEADASERPQPVGVGEPEVHAGAVLIQ